VGRWTPAGCASRETDLKALVAFLQLSDLELPDTDGLKHVWHSLFPCGNCEVQNLYDE